MFLYFKATTQEIQNGAGNFKVRRKKYDVEMAI